LFVDATGLTEDTIIDADLCIIGAGAAGISIAREFIGSTTRVAVLESGDLEFDLRTQSLYTGENTGLPSFDLEVNRLRYFGGTTNHWAGHCRPLDPVDFGQRDWVPDSGWPITRSELEPYYQRAQSIVELGPYEYEDLDFWKELTGLPSLNFDTRRLKTAVYNQSPPTRFGKAYRQELKLARNVTVYLNANVLEIETNETASRINRLRAACIDGPKFFVTANQFILATGGMENARLLLLSNKIAPTGLGNDNDLVGRYFMDHVLLRPGANVSFSDPGLNLQLYSSTHEVGGGNMFAVLAATEKLVRKEKINNFRIHLVKPWDKLKTPVGRIFSEVDAVHGARNHTLNDEPTRQQRRDAIDMHLVLEPMPNPDSRISLSDKLDLFGQQKLAVNWQLKEADLVNARRALQLAALEFGRTGKGRAYGPIFKDPEVWPHNLEAGRHHCGTTRMTDNPKTGVVDPACKVNGVSNMYVTGSSVFPTIGYANPTLTIVALALRLADHMKERLA